MDLHLKRNGLWYIMTKTVHNWNLTFKANVPTTRNLVTFHFLALKNCDESKVMEIDSKKARVKTYLATLFYAKKKNYTRLVFIY